MILGIKKITSSEFEKVLNSTLNFSSIYNHYLDIVKFFYYKDSLGNFKYNQTDYYLIEGLSSSYLANKSLFNSFGIVHSNTYKLREFRILIVEKDKNFSFPKDEIPTHACILSDDEEFIKKEYKRLSTIYKGIEFMHHIPGYDIDEDRLDKILKNISPNITEDNKNKFVFDLEVYCKMLSGFSYNSADYINEYIKCINIIRNNCGKRLLYCANPEYTNQFVSLIVELNGRYGIPFINLDYCNDEFIRTCIMESVLNEKYQLKEDLFSYIVNLPPVLFNTNGIIPFVNLVNSKTIKFTCFYKSAKLDEDLEDNCNVLNSTFNLKDVEIIKLSSLFDLNSVAGCRLAKTAINSFYDKIMLQEDEIIDVTKLIVFKKKDGHDEVFLGVVTDFNVNVNIVKLSIDLKTTFGSVDIGFKELKDYYPPNIFADGNQIASVVLGNLGGSRPKEYELLPMQCSTDYSYLIRTVRLDKDTLSKIDIPLITLGLYSQRAATVRSGFYKNFIEYSDVSIKHLRDQLDCFGGVTPGLVDSISLNKLR